MPQHNMYQEVTGSTNLRNLANLQDINSITEVANGLLASITDEKKKERVIEHFYDKMLLDTIKLGAEHNVFVKYCETKTVPNGTEKYLLRRWGGLTEHTYPLPEGIPPKSDRMASESFTGTFCSYGRYMEFTDRVDFMLIDDVIAHYTMELGDTAVRLMERLCREELIANAGEIYPNGKTFEQLVIGDTVGIADYRLQALKFKRILVKPLAGNSFVVICSPEHIYDLVNDPLVDKYMQYTNTAEPYMTGKPLSLFDLKFEETMLDDYSYGYTEMSNPGEYVVSDGGVDTYKLRVVFTDGGSRIYANFNSGENSATTINRIETEAYLKDGSWIPNKVTWDLEGWKKAVASLETKINVEVYTYDPEHGWVQNTGVSQMAVKDLALLEADQLPVHRSFMFGKEFIYKTGIDGRMGAKMYIKQKGSAGVLDPIDQRQSVGYKIDTLGFNTVRAEAMVQYIFVPEYALDTYQAVKNSWSDRFPSGKKYDTEVKREAAVNVKKDGVTYDESTVATHITEGTYEFTEDLNE